MVEERPGLARAAACGRQTCIFCHNTDARTSTAVCDELHGPAARPATRARWSTGCCRASAAGAFEVADAAGARARRSPTRSPPSAGRGPRRPGRRRATTLLRARHPRSCARASARAHLVEVGIGCEACHGGGREHVDDPRRAPDVRAAQPVPARRAQPARRAATPTRAEWINRACARCHQVLFSRYPFTWEGGRGARRRRAGRQLTSTRARRATSCSAAARARWRARPATIRTARTAARSSTALAHARGQRASAPRCHAELRERRRRSRRTRTTSPAGAGGALRRLPHAAQEHGARLRAHALPPHRLARPTRARVERRSPARVRALPRRQDASPTLVGDDGALVGQALRPRRAARALRRPRGAARSLATLARGKAARAGDGAGRARRGAAARRRCPRSRASSRTRTRWCATTRARAVERAPRRALRRRPRSADAEIEAAARRCVPEAFARRPPAPTSPARGAATPDED